MSAFVETTSAMREAFAKTWKTGFYEPDPHPNADGHAVIARAIEPSLRKLMALDTVSR